MECLVIFGAENEHPLAWLLNRERRHVWCAVQDIDRNAWVSYNWHQGAPIIQAESAADFDLATHYRRQGYTVVASTRGKAAILYPLMLNNCVGHVKLLCGIRSWAVTPNQLYNAMTGKGLIMKLKRLFTLPGFGGGSPAPPPPPPPLPPPPTKADPAVVKAREDEQRRMKMQRGMAGTIKTGTSPLDAAQTANKTLLGN
jgi:hypothetical protein